MRNPSRRTYRERRCWGESRKSAIHQLRYLPPSHGLYTSFCSSLSVFHSDNVKSGSTIITYCSIPYGLLVGQRQPFTDWRCPLMTKALTLPLPLCPLTIVPRCKNAQRRDKIRQVFLDFFGAATAQRAENVSKIMSKGGAGERVEVTAHQLKRFFGLCGTPAKAKVSGCRIVVGCNGRMEYHIIQQVYVAVFPYGVVVRTPWWKN